MNREPLRIVVAGGALAFVGLLAALVPLLGGFIFFLAHVDFAPGPPPSLGDALVEAVLARLGLWPFYGAGALCLAVVLGLYRRAGWERTAGRAMPRPARVASASRSAAQVPARYLGGPIPRRVTAAAGLLGLFALLALVPAVLSIIAAADGAMDPRVAAAWWLAGLGALIVAGLTAWMAVEARALRRSATWFGPPLALLAGVPAVGLSLLIGISNLPLGIVPVAGGILGLVGIPYVAWALWSTRGPLAPAPDGSTDTGEVLDGTDR